MKTNSPSLSKVLAILFLSLSSFSITNAQTCTIIGDTISCENEVLNYTSVDTGYVYQWNAYNGVVLGLGPSISVNWNTPGTGLLTLVVKDNLNQVICTQSLTVTIVENPTPEIYPSFVSSCSNIEEQEGADGKDDRGPCFAVCDSTWITYSTPNNIGNSYSWNITGVATTIPSTSNEIQVMWLGPGTGLVEVTETDSNGCTGYHSICVDVKPKPIAAIGSIPVASGGVISVCNGQDVQFINNSTPGAGSPLWSYTWHFGDGNTEVIEASSGNGNTVYNYSPGTYNVMLVAENECHCTDTAYVTVMVSSNPGPDIECVSTVCPGSTVTYSTNATCPDYLWSVTNGTIVGDSTFNEVTVTWGSSAPAYLTLETVGCSGLCDIPTTVEIPIIEPNATIFGPTEVCQFECQTYSISCNIPVDSIVWHFPAGVNVQTDTINEHEVKVCFYDASFTGGQIKVEYYHHTPGSLNELSCGGTALLDISVKPQLFLNYPAEICDSTILTGSHTAASSGSILWEISDAIGTTTYLSTTQAANAPFQPLWSYGPGLFTITAEDLSGNYCNAPQSFILTVNELPPPPDSIIGPDPVCPGVAYQYYAFSTSSNYAIQWDFINGDPGSSAGQSASTIWDNTGPYVISTYQINPLTGCISPKFLDTINSLLPLQPSDIFGYDTVCSNGQQSYFTTSLGDDFVWTITPSIAGSVVSGQYEQNIVIEWNNYVGPATLTLERTACDQSITTDYDVEVIAPPIPVISVPLEACEAYEVMMTAASSGATFTWDFGDGNTDVGDTVYHTYNGAGGFLVTVEANYTGFCSGTATEVLPIMINPNPDINISTPDPNIFCGATAPVNMFVSAPVTGTGYTWYDGTGPIASGSAFTSSTIGTYYVVGANSFGCVDTSNVIAIDTSCVPPCIPLAGSFVDFTKTKLSCNESSFAGTFSPWASSPVYTFDDPYSGINSAAGANVTHTFTEPGYYRVKLCVKVPEQGTADSCVICTTKVDTINYVPDFIDSTYCVNGSGMVNVKFINNTKVLSTAPSPTYEWTINSGAVVSTAINPDLAFTPGTYLITLIVNGTCEVSKTIVIDPLPNANFAAVDSVCVDAPIIFTSLASGSYNSYVWYFGDGATSLVENPIKTYSPAGDYDVSLAITNAYGCTDSVTTSVTVLPNTLDASIVALSDTLFCEGDSVALQSTVTLGYPTYDYLWSTIETSPDIVAYYTGQYYVESMDSKGCFARSNKINVLASPTPAPSIDGELTACLYEQTPYSVNYPDGSYTIEWELDGTPQTWITTSSYNFYANSVGPHVLVVKVTSGVSCVGSDTIYINVVNNPSVSIATTGALCEGETHLLDGNTTSTNIVSDYWNTGSANDTLYASVPGTYTYTVVDAFGCAASASATIHPLPEFCGLLTGCYDICDTISELVWHAPQGYASYQWLYNDADMVGSTYDTLHVPLYQSGSYQVVMTSAYGCTDTSEYIDIQFVPCGDCEFRVRDSIACGPVDIDGNQTYNLQFEINNTVGAGSIVNISSLQGLVSAISPTVLPLGISTVTATFTDLPPENTFACFTVTLTYNNERCGVDVCSDLPDCEADCELSTLNLCVHCLEENNGGWTYNIELTVMNPFVGNANLSIQPIVGGVFGPITPNPIPPGLTTVTFPFTDTLPVDSIICFKVLLEYGHEVCEQDICALLPDCFSTTGIGSNSELSVLSAFPNPTSEKVYIRYSTPGINESTISINDIRGRVVYTQKVKDSGNTLDLRLDYLKPGVYFVGLKNSAFNGNVQLIITND